METSQQPAKRWPAKGWPMISWVAILVLTGLVQMLREQWFDAALFLAAAVLTAVGPRLPEHSLGRSRGLVALAVLLVAGALMLVVQRHSTLMVGAIAVVGLMSLVLGWSGPAEAQRRSWSPGLRRLGAVWAALLVLGCLWELGEFLVGYFNPATQTYALSELLDPLLNLPLGKAAFVVLWIACGLFLLRRGRPRPVALGATP